MFENVIMPLLPSGDQDRAWESTWAWLYRCCFILSVLLLIGFAAVLPIDSIAQASVSDNNALNTFIVVGAIVIFFIICVAVIVGRLIYRKSCLIDIPRRYLPVSSADLPHAESREYILQHMDRSKGLGALFKKPRDPVVHDGLEPPLRCDNLNVSATESETTINNNTTNFPMDKIFPEYLNYETCMRVVANRIKYQGFFLSVINLELKTEDTFADIIKRQFILGNDTNPAQVQKAKRFIALYQQLQYSGNPIKRGEFTEFVELSIYFADIIATSDLSQQDDVDNLTKINTKSNQSLKYRESKPSWNKSHLLIQTEEEGPLSEAPLVSTVSNIRPFQAESSTNQHLLDNDSLTNDDTEFAADDISYFPSGNSFVRRRNSTGSVAKLIKSNQGSSYSEYTSANGQSYSESIADDPNHNICRDIHTGKNVEDDPSNITKPDLVATESNNSVIHHM